MDSRVKTTSKIQVLRFGHDRCLPIKTGKIVSFIAKSKSRKECELKLMCLKIYYFLVTVTLALPEKVFCWMMAKEIS